MEFSNLVTVVLCLLFLIQTGNALRCYTCTFVENTLDESCINNPAKAAGSSQADCNKKYCTIMRQEYKDPKGKVQSLQRFCQDDPQFKNEIVEDETHRTYFTACQTDLCNGGSGKSQSGGTRAGSLGDKSTIYAPGIGSTAANISVGFSVCFILILAAVQQFF